MGTKKNGLELYLHIPFCIKKCDYCDFLSGPSTRAGQEAYIYALLREMETVSKNLKKRPVDTVFIGGGKASLSCHLKAFQKLCIIMNSSKHSQFLIVWRL